MIWLELNIHAVQLKRNNILNAKSQQSIENIIKNITDKKSIVLNLLKIWGSCIVGLDKFISFLEYEFKLTFQKPLTALIQCFIKSKPVQTIQALALPHQHFKSKRHVMKKLDSSLETVYLVDFQMKLMKLFIFYSTCLFLQRLHLKSQNCYKICKKVPLSKVFNPCKCRKPGALIDICMAC